MSENLKSEDLKSEQESRETTHVEGVEYDCSVLESYAKGLETQEIDIEPLLYNLGKDHYYWDDKKLVKIRASSNFK